MNDIEDIETFQKDACVRVTLSIAMQNMSYSKDVYDRIYSQCMDNMTVSISLDFLKKIVKILIDGIEIDLLTIELMSVGLIEEVDPS
jgi:hypothetical protein